MPFQDLRDFIARLETAGEALRIEEEVDWDLEAGAMIRRANEADLPALLFQKVKGYPPGYRLFGEGLRNHRQIALALNLDRGTPARELVQAYLQRKGSPLKPILVKDGPCKENVCLGGEVDLLKFPVPMIHEGDGGRYIGTWHLTICQDPESGWVNWGVYRHMLHDRNTVGLQAGSLSHILRILRRWADRGRPMEVAIAIGVDPLSFFCASSPIPYGVSEAEVAGGLRGEPVSLVRCETVDLEVPAAAEIVLEGEVDLSETREEGPFGEYTGYLGGHRESRPVIRVRAVTHRNDPILTIGNEGMPVTCGHAILSVTRSAECLEILRAQGVPVTAVYEFMETCALLVVVAVPAGLARADDVAHVIWGSRIGASTPWIIVVEDDVDPFDLPQVLQALVSKCHPYRGIHRLERARGHALFPFLSRHEQRHLLGARACFDCTWPPDWEPRELPRKCSFESIYPPPVRQKALARWRKLGY